MRIGNFRGGRRDIDNPAPTGLDHTGKKTLAAVVGSREVYSEHVIPKLICHFEKARRRSDAGVIDQNLNRFTPGGNGVGERIDLRLFPHVTTERERPAAFSR